MIISADRLKELRKNKNITQKQLADLLGISDRNYRRYESGNIDPATSSTIILADYFKISIDYLVGRSDDPHRY